MNNTDKDINQDVEETRGSKRCPVAPWRTNKGNQASRDASTISIDVSPTITVHGSKIENASITENTDNRTRTNPSIGEAGAAATSLVGAILGALTKR